MFNLANNLTLVRVAVVPVLIVLLYYPGRITCLAAMLVFLIASLTDIFDGAIARRFNLVTNFGKFLDPLADKILITSVLFMLVYLQRVEPWIAIAIVCREIAVTGLRAMAVDKGVVIAADVFGKLKTILQIAALCPLLLYETWYGFDPRPAGYALLYLALALTLISGLKYFYNFYIRLKDEA